jgi:hypothetical protein
MSDDTSFRTLTAELKNTIREEGDKLFDKLEPRIRDLEKSLIKLGEIAETNKARDLQIKEQGVKIEKLEKFRYYILGAIAIVVPIFHYIVNLLAK